jgi:hypothetical protein
MPRWGTNNEPERKMRDQSNQSPAQTCGDLHAAGRDPPDSLRPSRLNRQDAARFLTQMGLPIAATTLAKKAVEGSGPPYAVWNGRALYSVDDLLKWAEAHLGPKFRNTTERRGRR